MADTVRRSTRNKRPESPAGAKTRSKSNAPAPAHAALLKMKAKKTQPKSVKKTAQAEVIPDVEPEVAEEENADEDEEPQNENITEEKHEDSLDAELATEDAQNAGASVETTSTWWQRHKDNIQQRAQRNPDLALTITNTAAAAASITNDSAANRRLSFRLDQDSYESDDSGSNYSTSAGVKEEMCRKQEVQDEEGGESEELQDEKGGELEEDGEGDGANADDDDDCEEEEEVALDYDLVPGPLSQQDKEDAVKPRAAYQAEIQAIARRGGKKVSAVLKAIGDLPVSVRDSNPWNAHQVRYRAENPKPSGMRQADYRAACKAAYLELFAHLSEDEMNDPGLRADATEELMVWYRATRAVAIDNRKTSGRGMAMLRKVVDPFIHQSTLVSKMYDIEIFGYAVDRFTDHAHIWGGSPVFHEANELYPGAIQQDLFDWKARIRNAVMERRRQAEGGGAEDSSTVALHIDFARIPREAPRDAMRRQIAKLFLNLIYVILLERGEERATLETTFKRGFPWKWSPAAVKHQLRIENWPTTLKATFPGPGFDLSHIKDGDAPADASRNKAMREMHGQLKSVYLGTEDASGATTIVSWSDEEMGLDDPRDVPIVTCADGTTLLTAASATSLIRELAKRREASTKTTKTKQPRKRKAAEPVDPEPSDRAHPKRPRRDPAAPRSEQGDKDDTRNEHETPDTPDMPHGEDAPEFEQNPTPPAQAAFPVTNLIRGAINCTYVNGQQVSSAFAVPKLHALGPAERTGPCHHDVWYYAPGPRLWKPVPDGMVPDFSPEFTDKLECLRLNIGLY
ncbi:hypothetical protein DFH08DRAFT_1014903 [Mycena albidolilacea]|uniref:Uncharacterized protein n=1 Tax=Mycena albidolilacea TaxID=1033008 RepID=A0AAD6ZU67_9AGAR|nr:hypothetical protein DFH08DRAFT_1014903 [Mycena albidolilacea]